MILIEVRSSDSLCSTEKYTGIVTHTLQPSLWVRIPTGTLVFSQSEMRRHLFKMLKEKKLTMFPVLKKKLSVRVTEGNPILVVYCTCRMPEVGDMIECSNCEEWFHVPSCSSLTQAALNDTTSLWLIDLYYSLAL